jgi:hypothetical protein
VPAVPPPAAVPPPVLAATHAFDEQTLPLPHTEQVLPPWPQKSLVVPPMQAPPEVQQPEQLLASQLVAPEHEGTNAARPPISAPRTKIFI